MAELPYDVAELRTRLQRHLLDAAAGPEPSSDQARGTALYARGETLAEALRGRDLTELGGLQLLVSPVARALVHEPENWASALRKLEVFAGRPLGIAAGIGPGALPSSLLRELIDRADGDTRVAFFDGLDDWFTRRAVASLLPDLVLTDREARAAIARLDETSRGDVTRPDLLVGVEQWAAGRVPQARAIVNDWLAAPPHARKARWDVLLSLSKAAVRAPDGPAWRATLLDAARVPSDRDTGRFAVFATCFVWPTDATPAVRHAAMLDAVRSEPAWLVEDALLCMTNDVSNHPLESLRTTAELLRLASPNAAAAEDDIGRAVMVATVAARALARRGSEARLSVLPLLPNLLPIPPGEAGWLDTLLALLYALAPGETRDFLSRWACRHGVDAVETPQGLQATLPLLYEAAFGDLLVEWLLHPQPSVRYKAIVLLAQEDGLPDAFARALEALGDTRACAMLHVLASSAVPVELSLAITLRVTTDRPRLRDDLRGVLEELADDHPETTRRVLAHSAVADDLAGHVMARIRAADVAHEARLRVPELEATRATQAIWDTLFAERLEVEMARAQQGMALLSQLTPVPIIRGAAMVTPAGDGTCRTELKEVRSRPLEFPLSESIDPTEARRRREAHQRRASDLLRPPSAGPS